MKHLDELIVIAKKNGITEKEINTIFYNALYEKVGQKNFLVSAKEIDLPLIRISIKEAFDLFEIAPCKENLCTLSSTLRNYLEASGIDMVGSRKIVFFGPRSQRIKFICGNERKVSDLLNKVLPKGPAIYRAEYGSGITIRLNPNKTYQSMSER